MRSIRLALMLATTATLLIATSATAAKKTATPAPPFGGAPHAELPGQRIKGIAFPRTGLGSAREVVLLVATTGATPAFSLLRVGTGGAATLTLDPVRADAGAGATSLVAADLDLDGADEVVVARPGFLDAYRRDVDGRFEGLGHPLTVDPALGDPSLDRTLVTSRGLVCLAVVGELRCWGRNDAAPAVKVPIPVAASREDDGLVLRTPKVRRIGTRRDGSTLLAVGPEEVGRRLRTVVIDLDSGFAARRIESWALLPAAEEMLESAVMLLDDAPVLVVTTRRSDKLSLTGEKRLRLFALEEDRTRKGVAPIFSAETEMNLWQDATFAVADVDRDGRQDLLAGYWKGLGDAKATVEVFRGRAKGGFEGSSAKTVFHVEKENRAFFSLTDLDGDGGLDLLLSADGRMQVHRGGRDPANLFPAKPTATSAPAAELGTRVTVSVSIGEDHDGISTSTADDFHLVDLDGDGRTEIVATGASSVSVLHLLP